MTTEINADAREIAQFEALAHRWWDPMGEMRPLHQINPLRLEYIEQRCCLRDRKILDVGCGGGLLSEAMAAKGASVTGVDLAEASLEVARLHVRQSGLHVEYRNISVEILATQEAGSFDVVTCMEMLEHVPDPESVVRACTRLVRPGGTVFFSTLNRNPKAYLLAVLGAEYIMRMLPAGTHDYKKFIRPSELGAWCRQSGLTINGMTGLNYHPIHQDFYLGDNVDVNYIMHCQRGSQVEQCP
jgi:2-polyprenyl-6-hydroxyphenyl methylase/3-demethylubiquinone-9 3-methyltransferase